MEELCTRIVEHVFRTEKERMPDKVGPVRDWLASLCDIVGHYSADTSGALRDFLCALDACISGKGFPPLDKFAPFFGRGQQYLSFIRRG